MKVSKDAGIALREGLALITQQFQLPDRFSESVDSASRLALNSFNTSNSFGILHREDATSLPFITLDPAGSTDLDQAFCLEKVGDSILLQYALADVGTFVVDDDPIDREAWNRGLTIYGLREKIPLYPSAISQGAASLLPDGPRPAILVTVEMSQDCKIKLSNVRRVVCKSRAQLSYDQFDVQSIPYLQEFAERMWKDEVRRGAIRVEFPQQEVVVDSEAPGGIRLELRARNNAGEVNSTLSLATNIAIGNYLQSRRIGLFRVMDEPSQSAVATLRRSASVLGIAWRDSESLRDLQRRMDPENRVHQRFLLDARRAGGRAHYALFDPDKPSWHSAIGATYSHATASLRRLADRYTLQLTYWLWNQLTIPEDFYNRLSLLPQIMERFESRAASVERAVIDLVEAVALQDRIGEILDGEVVDEAASIVQIREPVIRAKVAQMHGARNGEPVRVRIDFADPISRTIRLSCVDPT